MEIIRGKLPSAKKVVLYGPEGVGKSTFASMFPEPLFIDTEGSTKEMDVARTKKPSSWTMLLSQVDEVIKDPALCKTLVVDTLDWAEQLCIQHICDKHQKSGIESFGYGNGYVYVKEEFGRFLNKLEDVIGVGIHVVLTAHAQLRKFEQPDEMGAYDRWELKLGKKTSSQTSPLVKEWADLLLFANYKTMVVAADDSGKKYKAQGKKRVMYTSHHPCWDAKNRYGLADELSFDYGEIVHIIEPGGSKGDAKSAGKSMRSAGSKTEPASGTPGKPSEQKAQKSTESAGQSGPKNVSPEWQPAPAENATQMNFGDMQAAKQADGTLDLDERIPEKLRDLMIADHIGAWDLEEFMSSSGFVPIGTEVWEFDKANPGIIDGLIIPDWKKAVAKIRKMKETQEIPFD